VEVDRDEIAAHDVLRCGVLRCVAVCVAVVGRRVVGS